MNLMFQNQWHDTFIQLRHILFLVLPLLVVTLPHLGLHRIPILGAFIPAPPQTYLAPPQYQLQGQRSGLPPNITLNQMSSMTLQTLGHLVPTLHLLKYTNAAVMRSQDDHLDFSATEAPSGYVSPNREPSPTAKIEPSLLARASQWWAQEAREGSIIRNDENVRRVLKNAGLGLDDAIKEGDEIIQPDGQLLASARKAVAVLKEQGARPSEHWIWDGPGS